MNTFVRWWKFNLVGAVGMGVQLGTLALLNRWWRGHYLLASATAVELTLLHNFLWHVHYTWRDRSEGALPHRLLRFHFSNGAVSLIGNLVLMRLFVHGAHLPVLLANGIAVLCCSIANFYLSDLWAFANARSTQVLTERRESPIHGSFHEAHPTSAPSGQ